MQSEATYEQATYVCRIGTKGVTVDPNEELMAASREPSRTSMEASLSVMLNVAKALARPGS
jgi:hypothetical protein